MERSAGYYRTKAEESRTIAAESNDEGTRATLLDVAEQYDELARKADVRGN